jgi:hypothetical protein
MPQATQSRTSAARWWWTDSTNRAPEIDLPTQAAQNVEIGALPRPHFTDQCGGAEFIALAGIKVV